jgi:cytochrome P450
VARQRSEEFRKAVAEAVGAGCRFEDIAKELSTTARPFCRRVISRWLADPDELGEQFRGWVKAAREKHLDEIRERVPVANMAYRVAVLAEAHEKVLTALQAKAYPSEGLIRSLLAIQQEVAEEIGDRIERKEIAGAGGAPLIAGFETALEKSYGSEQPQ